MSNDGNCCSNKVKDVVIVKKKSDAIEELGKREPLFTRRVLSSFGYWPTFTFYFFIQFISGGIVILIWFIWNSDYLKVLKAADYAMVFTSTMGGIIRLFAILCG